jgi:hypothetical protein
MGEVRPCSHLGGWLLIELLYEDNGEVNAKVFNNTYCRMHYHGDNNDDYGDEQKTIIQVSRCSSFVAKMVRASISL